MQKKGFKIHRGCMQGLHFAYPRITKNHSFFTPSILKEALFELLLNRIQRQEQKPSDYAFFDLCAGSAQIGLEAASIGFQSIHLAEIASQRIVHIKKIRQEMLNSASLFATKAPLIQVYCRDYRKMLKPIRSYSHSVIYLDLPYPLWKTKPPPGLSSFLLKLQQSMDKENCHIWVFIQAPCFYKLDSIHTVNFPEFRRYGKQHLSFWLYMN